MYFTFPRYDNNCHEDEKRKNKSFWRKENEKEIIIRNAGRSISNQRINRMWKQRNRIRRQAQQQLQTEAVMQQIHQILITVKLLTYSPEKMVPEQEEHLSSCLVSKRKMPMEIKLITQQRKQISQTVQK